MRASGRCGSHMGRPGPQLYLIYWGLDVSQLRGTHGIPRQPARLPKQISKTRQAPHSPGIHTNLQAGKIQGKALITL